MAQGEFEKESRDPMIKRLAGMLEADLKNRGDLFCIQGHALEPDEVASHNGLLSLFCFKAAETCEEVMRKKLPLYYEHDTDALINVTPMAEPTENNMLTLWAHFLHYSVEEEIRRHKKQKKLINGMIPLDELYQQWHDSVQTGTYTIRPSTKPAADAKS